MCERRDDTPDSNSVSQRIVEARFLSSSQHFGDVRSIPITFIIPLLFEIFQTKDNIPLPFEILAVINCVEFAFNSCEHIDRLIWIGLSAGGVS